MTSGASRGCVSGRTETTRGCEHVRTDPSLRHTSNLTPNTHRNNAPRISGNIRASPATGAERRPSSGTGTGVVSARTTTFARTATSRFDGGKGTVANGLAKQAISLNPADHEFYVHKERGFKPLVKQQGPTAKSEKKAKPNDPCPGGCGQKVKKCKCSAK